MMNKKYKDYSEEAFTKVAHKLPYADYRSVISRRPLVHSNELLWDPRDQPRKQARPQRMTARTVLAWGVVIVLAIVVIWINVG